MVALPGLSAVTVMVVPLSEIDATVLSLMVAVMVPVPERLTVIVRVVCASVRDSALGDRLSVPMPFCIDHCAVFAPVVPSHH